jgi:hypothetical protein
VSEFKSDKNTGQECQYKNEIRANLLIAWQEAWTKSIK